MPQDEDNKRLLELLEEVRGVVYEEDLEKMTKLREISELQRKLGVELIPDTDAALERAEAEQRALEGTPDYERMQDIMRRIRLLGYRVPQRFLDELTKAQRACGLLDIVEVEVMENPPRSPFLSEEEWAKLLDLDTPAPLPLAMAPSLK